jgi:predicted nucleic acid-binding protein
VISAFVDTSVLLSILFQESASREIAARLERFDVVYCSNLLEAELRSVCKREARAVDGRLLDELRIALPSRSLEAEILRVLEAGYVRGADCLHLATALFLAPDTAELTFLTLDKRQRDVAIALGFAV